MQTTFECTVCGNEAKWFCGHGCKTPYCGVSCARSVYDTHKELCSGLVGEGVIDVFRDEKAFFNSFNLIDSSKRQNVIRTAFADLEETYEKNYKKFGRGSGLKKKLTYFKNALKRIISENNNEIEKNPVKQLSTDEARIYPKYIQQIDVWYASI